MKLVENIFILSIKPILLRAFTGKRSDLKNFYSLGMFVSSGITRNFFKFLKNQINENGSFCQLFLSLGRDLNQNYKRKLVENLVYNEFIKGEKIRQGFKAQGTHVPVLLVISPTMRCNLNCTGCYAGKYKKSEDLPDEIVDKVLEEAKEMGVYFIVVSGGEPYLRKEMWLKLFEKYNDMFFLTYTNGTLIDEKLAKELARLGNVAPAISVEGFCEETNERRGQGVYEKVLKAMESLKKEKCLFGFSATVTRNNNELLSSEEFIKFYISKGTKFGWYFMFMPVGKEPDVNMIPTPEQRLAYGNRIKKLREKYPIFAADFWNDGPAVGGCMAGRSYLHVLYNGNVEPCVFVHFAIDNVKNKSLKEIMASDFFKFFRDKHPYSKNKNLMTPCAVIDNPEILREAVSRFGALPSHEGSDAVIKDPKVVDFIDNYSKKFKALTDPIWEKEFINNPESSWFKDGENYKRTFIEKR
jgi:MoaA/NifB/PqqE/SkfB family radical SAM enzyme